MATTASATSGDVGFYMDGSGWGAQANLPWLKDALNDVFNATGVTSAVNSALQAEAQVLAPVLNGLGQGLSDLLGIGGWGQNYTQRWYTDTTTGKKYPSVDALYKGRDIDAMVAQQGIPVNVATALVYADQIPQLKDAVSKWAATQPAGATNGMNLQQMAWSMYTQANPTPQMKAAGDARLKFLLSVATDPAGIKSALDSYKQDGFTLRQEQLPIIQAAATPIMQQAQSANKAALASDAQQAAMTKASNDLQAFAASGSQDKVKLQQIIDAYTAARKGIETPYNEVPQWASTMLGQGPEGKLLAAGKALQDYSTSGSTDLAKLRTLVDAYNAARVGQETPYNMTPGWAVNQLATGKLSVEGAKAAQQPQVNQADGTNYLKSLLGGVGSPMDIVKAYKAKGYQITPDQKPILQQALKAYVSSGQYAKAQQTARQKLAGTPQAMGNVPQPTSPQPMGMTSTSPTDIGNAKLSVYGSPGQTQTLNQAADARLSFLMQHSENPQAALQSYTTEGFTLRPDQRTAYPALANIP